MGYPTAKPVKNWETMPDDTSILVKQHGNYADEFDYDGWQLWTVGDWRKYRDAVRSQSFPRQEYFGTNEYVVFDTADDYLRDFTVYKLTKTERAVLEKYFGTSYGMFFELEFEDEEPEEEETPVDQRIANMAETLDKMEEAIRKVQPNQIEQNLLVYRNQRDALLELFPDTDLRIHAYQFELEQQRRKREGGRLAAQPYENYKTIRSIQFLEERIAELSGAAG